jgi:hypothetical protein
METNKDIELIKHLIKGRIDDMEKRMDVITNYWDGYPENVQIEYEQNYLGRKAAYEDVLCLINDYLETPIQ